MKRFVHLSPALALVAVLALPGTSSAAFAQDVVSGPARVIDGDTIEIRGKRIRLHGIDAPESAQTCSDASGQSYSCGRAATQALAAGIGRAQVSCRARDRDRYGRLVAVCHVGGADLNAWMVRNGHAMAYRRYSPDYVRHENAARAARVGIWQGRFVAPWDWRRTHGAGNSRTPARREGCAIKGNVSSSGERVYHVPGQSHYGATRISEANGERWFCSEAEARTAGWRRARR